MVEHAPLLHLGPERLDLRAVVHHAHYAGARKHAVIGVQFNHGDLFLARGVADLGKAHIRFAYPLRVHAGLEVPAHDLTRLPGRDQGPGNEGTVLREHPAVVETYLLLGAH